MRRLLLLTVSAFIFCTGISFAQPTYTIQNKKDACNGLPNGSFEVLISAGTPPPLRVFVFGPPDIGPINATVGTPVSITGLPGSPGGKSYIVIVQDFNGSTPLFVTIYSVASSLTGLVNSAVNNTDCTIPNGSIDIQPAGGTGSYSFLWDGPGSFTATTEDLTGIPGGTYQLTIFDNGTNCQVTLPDIVLTDPSPVVQTITTTSPLAACTGSPAVITLGSSEPAPVNYELVKNGTPTGIIQAGTGGPLSFSIPWGSFANGDVLTIRAVNGFCTPAPMNGVIIVNIAPLPTAVVSGGGTVCAGTPLPSVTFTFTGKPPFNFTYTNGVTPVTVTGHNSTTFVLNPPATAGTYSVTALTDANGCVATSLGGTVQVIENARPTATIVGGGAYCAGDPIPGVTFNFTGTQPFNFTYSNGTASFTVNNHASTTFTVPVANRVANGTYSITALSDANCSGTSLGTPVSTPQNVRPTAVVSGGGTVCTGAPIPNVTFTFTGTQPFTFTYTDGTTPQTVTGLMANTYVITPTGNATYQITSLTDASACPATALGGTVTVAVNALPTATIAGGGPYCAGNPIPVVTFNFTGTQPFNFTYSNGSASFTVNNHASTTFTVPVANRVANGSYSITALTDANCTGTSLGTPVTTPQNVRPTAAVSGGGTVCAGAPIPNVTFTFTGTQPFTFTYTDGTTPQTVTGLMANTYVITPTGNATYQITSLTDASACPATALGGTVAVVVNALPTATIAGGGPYCAGNPIPVVTFNFTGTQPFNFTYSNGSASFTVNNHASTTFTVPVANRVANGSYSITALTDANCTGTSLGTPVTTPQSIRPTAVLSGGGPFCAGATRPNVTFTFTGTPPFNFTYTDGINPAVTVNNHGTFTYTILTATPGNYQVTSLTDASTCPATSLGGTIAVIQNALPTATIGGGGATCNGAPTPGVTFTFTGVQPFNFTYSNGTTSFTVNNHATTSFTVPAANLVANGSYSITALTDANCTGTSLGTPVTTPVGTGASVVLSGGGTVCSGATIPNVTFTFTGTQPFNFTYTDGTTPQTVTGLMANTYTVTPTATSNYQVTALSDASGCPAVSLGGTVPVVVNALPTATIAGGGATCNGAPIPGVTFTFTGAQPFNFTYSNGTTSFTVNNHTTASFTVPAANLVANGSYSITALTDANCTGTSLGTPVTTPVGTGASVVLSGGGTVCFGATVPDITFTFTGTQPFTFTYTDGTTPQTVTGLMANTYTVTPTGASTYQVTALSDASGCPATSLGGSVPVVVNVLPTATIAGGGAYCAGDPIPGVTFNLTGAAPFNFTYSNGTTTFTVTNHLTLSFTVPAFSLVANGTYSITTLNDANCAGTSLGTPVSTPEGTRPTVVLSGGGAFCAGATRPDVTFTFTGTPPFNFTYTDGINPPVTLNNHGALTYTVLTATPGNYQVTSLTDASTCPATSLGGTVAVIQNALPTATIAGGGASCNGAPIPGVTFTFTGVQPFDFTYSNGTTSFTVTGHTTTSFTVPAANLVAGGSYSITALTDANCTGTSLGTPVTTPVGTGPSVALSGGGTVCSGATIPDVTFTFTGTQPFTFTYTDGTTPQTVTGLTTNTYIVTPTATSNYQVTALSDASGCPATSLGGTVAVVVNVGPSAAISGGGSVCPGDPLPNVTFTFTGTQPFTFTYTLDGAPTTITNHTSTTFTIPTAAVGTYAITALSDAGVCPSGSLGTPVAVSVGNPTITLGPDPSVCAGVATANLTYTAITGGADEYSIDFDGVAQGAGFGDVTNQPLPAGQISITIPGAAGAGTYNATLTVRNSAGGCASTPVPFTVTIGLPTITLGPDPSVCAGVTPAVLTYSATTGSPDFYSIDFGPAAEGAGFADVADLALPAGAINITVPAAAANGTYAATITVKNNAGGCSSAPVAFNVIIGSPTIALGLNPSVCAGVTTANLPFTSTTGSPDQYSIDFDLAAETAGFADVSNLTLTGSSIAITVPAAAPLGVYNATLTVRNAAGACSSVAQPITITIGLPTIALGLNPNVCAGVTPAVLTYGATTGNPDQVSIDFDLAANTAGFADIANATLSGGVINIPVPGAVTAGTFNATLTVNNSAGGCSSTPQAITVTVGLPTITLGANPSVCPGVTTADINYFGTTGNPTLYSIDYNTTAENEGFLDVVDQPLPAGQISITIPAAAAIQNYSAVLTVKSGAGGCSSAPINITITVGAPTITLTNATPSVCIGATTANITYSATTGNPNQYSIDFNTAAEAAGFTDVSNLGITSPIAITIPGGAGAGTYSGVLTVRNSTGGCVSTGHAISVTIGAPTITLTGNPSVCPGVTSASLGYSATTGGVTQFSIDFDLTAETAGFADIATGALPAAPNQLNIPVPAGAAAGIYNATITVRAGAGCVSTPLAFTITVGSPTITLGANPSVCPGVTSADLDYFGTTGNPDRYSIDFDPAANTAGFADVVDQVLPAGQITIPVPAAAAAGTYNAVLTVKNNAGGCSSAAQAITVTIGSPTIALGANPSVCAGATTANLFYTSTTGNPNQYSIDFDTNAENAGFADVTNLSLPGSPIVITVPPAATAGTYLATLTVTNTSGGCSSTPQAISVIIGLPSIALGPNPTICAGETTTSLTYTATTGTPDEYTIDFDTNAEIAGFADVTATTLPASPIIITVPGGATAGTYNATITVTNTAGGCSSTATAFAVIIGAPTITLGPNPTVCAGVTTANLTYSAVSSSVTKYSIDFDAAAEGAGFADVTDINITPGQIAITVPAAAVDGTYNATLTVSNGTAGCVSTPLPIAVIIGVPTITLGANPSVCPGVTTATLPYTGTTGNPDTYSLDFDVAAQGQGFADVTDQPLPAGAISITVPGAAVAGNYNAILTVKNAAGGCVSTTHAVVVTLGAPTITLGGNPSICEGVGVANIPYVATTGNPNQFSVDFSPAAEGVGFVDIATATLSGGNIALTVPGSAVPGTYTATLTVRNSLAGGCVSASYPIAITVLTAGSPGCGGGGTDCGRFVINVTPTLPDCNDPDTGVLRFDISRFNGTPGNFEIVLNGPDGKTFTVQQPSVAVFPDLKAGNYTYTVTDLLLGYVCGPKTYFLDLKTKVHILDAPRVVTDVTCYDGHDGNVTLSAEGSTTGQYWFTYVKDGLESPAMQFTPGTPLPDGLPADDDDFIIIKVDESSTFSCPDTAMVRIRHLYPKIDFTPSATNVTTCNGIDGKIQVASIGGGNSGTTPLQARLRKQVPFSTDPSGFITVSDFETVTGGFKEYEALSQGNYIVDVKDLTDCIQSKSIAVQAPGQVPISVISIFKTDADCSNNGESGSIRVTITDPGQYQVAVSTDQVNTPPDDQFIAYNSPSLPYVVFNNMPSGTYFLYVKSNATTCPTRTEPIVIGGIQGLNGFEILSNCDNVNLTVNNLKGQTDAPFEIQVFSNNDKFFMIDKLDATGIPIGNSISFVYSPSQHLFLNEPGTYRFVMVQTQTTGATPCAVVSDTLVYDVSQQISIALGTVKPSFPDPKRTGSIEIDNIIGGTRFVSSNNEFYYEVSLSIPADNITVFDFEPVVLSPQKRFTRLYEFLPPGVYRITVRDATGCEKTQDVEIALDPSVYVPNIFTPNDDNVNDFFEVLNLPLGGKHSLVISNRWGNEVFKSSDYREGTFWDAQNVSDGIYYYRLKVEGGETFTGWVEIIRGTKP